MVGEFMGELHGLTSANESVHEHDQQIDVGVEVVGGGLSQVLQRPLLGLLQFKGALPEDGAAED